MVTSVPDVLSLCRRIGHQLPVLDAIKAGAELYGSPRLNAFDLFRPDENKLSSLIADLLHPRGAHGQGSLFLNELLRSVDLPVAGMNDHVSVKREVPTQEKRRIDLVLETPDVIVGVENKPWAVQQPDQLSDYLEALRRWAGTKQVALIFLSHQEAKTAIGEVVAVTFVKDDAGPSLEAVLTSALKKVRSDRARIHVQELLSYLQVEFGSGTPVDASDEAYVEAVQAEFVGRQNRRAIAATLLSYERLHKLIIDEIGDYLLDQLKGLHEDFESASGMSLYESLSEKQIPWELRRESWPKNLSVAIEADQQYLNKIFFGVRAPDPKSSEIRAEGIACQSRSIVDIALKSFGGGRKTAGWAWWNWCATTYWGPEYAAQIVLHSPTGNVGEHPEVMDISQRLVAFASSIDAELRKP